MGENILVVEDEKTLCANVARFLTRAGHRVRAVETGRDALAELETRTFDLVITDLRLPDIDGLAVLDRVREGSPETVTLIMTAYASVDSAVMALRHGAHDYMLKPLSLADLEKKVQNIAEYKRLGQENARLRTLLRGERNAMEKLRRGGRELLDLCDVLERVASSSSNVLVLGESGTGKELVARALHESSEHASGPFVTFNVSAVSDGLVEAHLFGAEPGQTGGEKGREGLFRAAAGGTLFLDEIGDLPLHVQTKLLHAVDEKEILPVGAERGVKVDTRIVAATHRDLGAMVREGTFRHDLLYRLQVVELRVPPLRARAGDIPSLAIDLLTQHAHAQGRPVRRIAPDAMALLTGYAWPGNVRELSNVIERAVILSTDGIITPGDLPVELGIRRAPPSSQKGADEPSTPLDDEAANLERATLAFQRAHIARVVENAGGREEAARRLGLSAATFYRYLTRVGLRGPQTAAEGD
jgi:DNA-binding NtrC family response regulator